MNIALKEQENSTKLLTITLEKDEWEGYKNKALRKAASQIKIDGFRKGHVPEAMVRQRIGEAGLIQEATDLALSGSYMKALQQEKLSPITQPEVKILNVDPLEYSVEVQVYPEVMVKKVDGKKYKPKAVKVTKKEISETMDTFRNQLAEKKPVTRKAKKGDTVIIDFDGKNDKGESQPGMQSEGHPLEIGSGTFIPGFEEEVTGMKKDEEKTFPITFPKDYHATEYAGVEFHFTVKVQDVMENNLPKLDDALAAKVTGDETKTVADLEEEVTKHLSENKEKQNYETAQKDFFEAIGKATTAQIPPALLEDELEGMIDNAKMQGLQMGMPWEKYLENIKKTEEELKKDMEKDAHKTVLSRLGLQELIKQDKIELSDEEIQAEIDRELAQVPEKDRKAKSQEYTMHNDGWFKVKNRLQIRSFFDTYLK